MPDDLVLRRPRVRRPAHLRLPVGQNAHAVALGIGDLEPAVTLLIGDAEVSEMAPCVLEGARAPQLVGHVPDAGCLGGDQLQREWFVVAGEAGASIVAFAFDQAELIAPAVGGVVYVGHQQAHVVDAAERDRIVTRTGRRLMPLKKLERRRSGGPMSSNPLTRLSISSKVMRISRRARCAPRQ